MSLYAFAIPVLPDMSDRNRTFHQELGTSVEAKSMHAKAGVDRVRIFEQETPQGTFNIVVWDTDNGERSLRAIMSAEDEFSMQFRSDLAGIYGPDVTDAPAMPTPELLAQWSDSDFDPKGNDYAFIVPIGRGKVDAFRSMIDEMYNGAQNAGFEETRRLLGVSRQTMFLLETPDGAFALPVLEGPGASRVFGEQLKRDDHTFFAWWRDQLRNVTGRIPTSPPKVEKLLDLMVKEPAVTKR